MPDACWHEQGGLVRTEVASVEIAQCPACGKDVEWDFKVGAPDGWVLVNAETLAAALRAWGGPGHSYWRVRAFPFEATEADAAAIIAALRGDTDA